MKILTLDIETSPNLAHVWSLWKQTVSLSQLRETSKVMCFSAKWYDQRGVRFFSEFHDGPEAMVQGAHDLLSEADVVVHYNGRRFDIPRLQQEFLLAGLTPPAPFQQVDLLAVVRKQFGFPSNKLDHVARRLELGGKVAHAGHELWVRCMAGDEAAWRKMRQYNVNDVRLTEKLYDRLLPWITTHPHHGLYSGVPGVCPNCGQGTLQPRGFAYTRLSKVTRYRCSYCGRWSQGKTAVDRAEERGVA